MIRMVMLAPKAIGTKVGKSSEKKAMDVDEYGIPMIFSASPQEPMQDIYVVSSGDDGGESSELFEEACGTSPVPARKKDRVAQMDEKPERDANEDKEGKKRRSKAKGKGKAKAAAKKEPKAKGKRKAKAAAAEKKVAEAEAKQEAESGAGGKRCKAAAMVALKRQDSAMTSDEEKLIQQLEAQERSAADAMRRLAEVQEGLAAGADQETEADPEGEEEEDQETEADPEDEKEPRGPSSSSNGSSVQLSLGTCRHPQ